MPRPIDPRNPATNRSAIFIRGISLAARLTPLLCLLSSAVFATAQTTINVPQSQPTIQSGINAAQSGDTVLVAPGTYRESIDFLGKAITVMSSAGPATTIIDGSGNSYTAIFQSGEKRSSILSGFTIQNGGSTQTTPAFGGVAVYNSQPVISGNLITHNHCYGINSLDSAPLIQNNTISFTDDLNPTLAPGQVGPCFSASGAGIWLEQDVPPSATNPSATTPIVIGNTIENNTQQGSDLSAHPTSGFDAGGAGIADAASFAIIESNIIRNNLSNNGFGGGIAFALFSDAAILNTKNVRTPYYFTGAIVAQNLIYANQAGCGGGGLHFNLFPRGESVVWFLTQQFTVNNTVAANSLGAPCLSGFQPPYDGSQIDTGDFVSLPELANNLIIANTSGSAIYCIPFRGALFLDEGAVFDHNDVYNPGGQTYGGQCQEKTGAYGNLSTDPLFKDAANADFHLNAGSPAIDAGNNSALQQLATNGLILKNDFDGNARVQDATAIGYPIVDMGAYEYSGLQATSPTAIVVTSSQYLVDVGDSITLTATLTSANGTPSGTASFFANGTAIGTAVINAAGVATLVTPKETPGLYSFVVTYPGQGIFTPATSVRVEVYFNQYPVNLTLVSAPNPSLLGTPVLFTATLSAPDGLPTGTLVFSDADTGINFATVTPNAKGIATFTISTLRAGYNYIQVAYAGDQNNMGNIATLLQVVDTTLPTTATLTSSLNPALRQQPVTLTTQISASGVPATGSVVFSLGNTTLATLPLVAGSAAFTTTALPVGSDVITATFPTTAAYSGSSATLTEVIENQPSTTAIVSVKPTAPLYALEPAVITAQVIGSSADVSTRASNKANSGARSNTQAPTPTGTVTFSVAGNPIGTATLNSAGIAALTYPFPSAGTQSITAAYNADGNYGPSTSRQFPVNVLINDSESTLSIVPSPAIAFQPTMLTATVASKSAASFGQAPKGTVNFFAGDTLLGSAPLNANGLATLTVTTFEDGTYTVAAKYPGSAAFASSNSSSSLLVITPDPTTATVTSSANPQQLGSPVTLTAKIAAVGTPNGTVNFFDGGKSLGPATLDATGSAMLTTSTLALGQHSITVHYPGTLNFFPSTSPALIQTIIPYTGNFTITAAPSAASLYTGETATFAALLTPTGNWNQDITLSCSGLPANSTCLFSPTTVPGANGTAKLTVQTTAPQKAANAGQIGGTGQSGPIAPANPLSPATSGALLAALAILSFPRRISRRLRRGTFWLFALLSFISLLSGCGANPVTGGTPRGASTIQINATYSGYGQTLTHSATVTLQVKSLF